MSVDIGMADARARRAKLEAVLRDRLRASCSRHALTHGQKALWMLHRLAPQSASYNTAIAVRIRSVLAVDRLARALDKLVLRHEAMRTTFTIENGAPVQCVWGFREVPLGQTDAAGARDGRLREIVANLYRRPFDLEAGPVLRLDLVSRAADDHVLLLTVHHIAADAWSLWILIHELFTLYGADGEVAPALPAVTPYSQFVKWQAEFLHSAESHAMAAYWQSLLHAPLPSLDLPTDRPRPPVVSHEGASLDFEIAPGLGADLRELARREGTTLYAVFLSAFQLVLRSLAGQDDIILGTLAAGRTQPQFAETVGYFVNPVVVRIAIDPQEPYRSLLQRVRAQSLDALDHQDYPFALVVERTQPRRDASRAPVFQVLFVQQKAQAAHSPAAIQQGRASEPATLRLEPFPFPQMEGQFDLTLEITDADAVSGVLRYSTALFDRATIARMAGLLQTVLASIVATPGAAVSELAMLPAQQIETLNAWNATGVAMPDLCAHDLIAEQVARTPDAVAVLFEGQSWTYREVNDRAESLAQQLRERGAGPEVLVGISLQRSLELVVAILGVLKADAAYVPLDPDYPRDRLTFMLDDANAAILITERGIAQRRRLEARATAAARPDNLAYVIYTSGSTGRPKGAMNTHRGLCNRIIWMQSAYRLERSDAVLQKTPFSFDVSVWEFIWPLMVGARLVICRPGGHQDPRYLATLMREQRVTTLHFVPSMLRAFVDQPELGTFPALRRVICSGEALPPEVVDKALTRLGAEVHNLYGPTEASIDVTYWACRRDPAAVTIPIGMPVANTQIHIVDRAFNACPIGVAGELCIAGVQVGRGYHQRPDLTADRFVPDPFGPPGARMYRTGDLARWQPGGEIVYLGRLDSQVKIRGFRIELGEIETRLSEHPSIRQAAVVTRAEADGDMRLVAYAVAHDQPASITELHQFLRQTLPDYMVPSAFVWVPALPLSPNGKLDRQALPAPSTARPALDAAFAEPITPDECRIAAVWRDVLKVDRIGVHDNFFELGGQSILLAQVHARLQQEGARELTLVEMFQHPTIHLLAIRLAGTPISLPANDDGTRASLRTQQATRLAEQRRSRLEHRQQEPPRA